MKKTLLLILTAAATATTGFAQAPAPVQNLSRAGLAFRTADANHNGALSLPEAQRHGMQRAQFKAFDADANGAIDKEEFMVAFRRAVLKGGGRIADDLDREVTRIMAKRKAEAEKERIEAERKRKARQQDARKKDARKKEADKPAERPPIRRVQRDGERPAPVRTPVHRTPRHQ